MRTWHPSTLVVAGLTLALAATSPRAASHREAPLMTLDPAADITDVYAFRSWEDPTKAVFIMNVIPSQVQVLTSVGLDHTRWPERETVNDWTQGSPLAKVQALCEHWRLARRGRWNEQSK